MGVSDVGMNIIYLSFIQIIFVLGLNHRLSVIYDDKTEVGIVPFIIYYNNNNNINANLTRLPAVWIMGV